MLTDDVALGEGSDSVSFRAALFLEGVEAADLMAENFDFGAAGERAFTDQPGPAEFVVPLVVDPLDFDLLV